MRRVVRQDIFNICRSKGVRSFERRDENDLNSIRKWIEELQAKDSVLIWTCDPQLFLLVVMNEHQAELAKRYGTVLYLADLPLALTSHYRIITLTVPAENDAYLIAYALTDEPGADILTVVDNIIGCIIYVSFSFYIYIAGHYGLNSSESRHF